MVVKRIVQKNYFVSLQEEILLYTLCVLIEQLSIENNQKQN